MPDMTTARLFPQRSADPPPAGSGSAVSAVSLRGVTCMFAGSRVLGPLSLEVDPGAVCLVEGANGAGKTTLLRVAAGLLAPTTGVRLAAGEGLYLRPGSGVRVEQTVDQALRWVGRMTPGRGISPPEALQVVGLDVGSGRPVRSLSSGMRARLSSAVALVAGPSVACLDEPTSHLDAAGVAAVTATLDGLAARGAALLLATHHAGDLCGLADTRIRLSGGLAEVRR